MSHFLSKYSMTFVISKVSSGTNTTSYCILKTKQLGHARGLVLLVCIRLTGLSLLEAPDLFLPRLGWEPKMHVRGWRQF